MDDLLKLLSGDCRLTNRQLAIMLDRNEDEITETLKELEKNHTIIGYKAIIDWDKTDEEVVTALIEVGVTPKQGEGFEKVAERIYRFDEVESLYLMSGGYDLAVTITGRTMREVALFVANKLASVDGVRSTSTHFILKKYKESGVLFPVETEKQETAYIL